MALKEPDLTYELRIEERTDREAMPAEAGDLISEGDEVRKH
jgi:hypothetical protein